MDQFLRLNRDILLIVLLALVIRVLAIVPVHSIGYTSDEREYIHMAGQLVRGGEFMDSNGERSTRAPLFPYVLSFIQNVFGSGLFIPHVIGCLSGTAIVILTFMLSMFVGGDRTGALVASGAAAIYPGLIIYSSVLQTETMYILFVLTAILFALKMIENPTAIDAIILAVASGLASLTRAVFVGFFPVLLILIGWSRRRNGMTSAGRFLALALVVWIVVLAPWALRNYSIHGILMPVSSGSGNSLLTGNNPYATGTWRLEEGFESWYQEEAHERGVSNVAGLSETERNALSREIALSYIASNPGHVLYLAVKKAYMFWIFPITNSDSNIPLQTAAAGAEFILYIGMLVGIVATWHLRWRLAPVMGALLFFFAVQTVLHCESRFRLPLVPVMCLFFGVAGSMALNRQRRSEFLNRKGNMLAAGVLIGFVVLTYGFTGWLFLTGVV